MIDGLYCPDLHHLVLQDCLGLPRNSFSEFFFQIKMPLRFCLIRQFHEASASPLARTCSGVTH